MWMEVVAALLVGGSLLWLVFEPIVTGVRPRPASPLDLDDVEETGATRSGAAIAALKEIEFDRETGKLAEEDYLSLKAKYTADAIQAMRVEGEEPVAPPLDIEAAVAVRVETLRGGPSAGPSGYCASCGSPLESGSRFCGSCGGRVAA